MSSFAMEPKPFVFDHNDLETLHTAPVALITDVEHISSYNWMEASNSNSTITTPGCPRKWSPPPTPFELNKFSGLVYHEQDEALHPEYPLEPLFRSLYLENPTFDIKAVNVVIDPNNLQKLLKFVRTDWYERCEFWTMNVEVVKDTAIFCREQDKSQEFLLPDDPEGVVHKYKDTFTFNKVHRSIGHHRVISYSFDDLKFLVRYECDGYVHPRQIPSSSTSTLPAEHDISSMMGALQLSTTGSSASSKPTIKPHNSKIYIQQEGEVVPRELTLAIKTGEPHKPIQFEHVAPQLWASQTPMFIRAHHRNRVFGEPIIEHVTKRVEAWEIANQDALTKLGALLKKIVEETKKCGGKAVVHHNHVEDTILVQAYDEIKMLPDDLYAKWHAAQDNTEDEMEE